MRTAQRDPGELLHRLITGYRARLLRYVNRLTLGDPHRAEDIVQEAMLRVWRLAAQHPPPADASEEEPGYDEDRLVAWLYTVARNLAVDAHRRDRTVPMGVVPAPMLQRTTETDVADTVVNRHVLHGALARLTPEHREVLVQVHLCDRSRADAARAIGIPQGTVKSRTHYALLAMRREMRRENAAA
ncbi:sigma-70 family RNA polymerase sigma factor [Streptomyces carpaticus]|uniref:Sigma-70 family RNA polymerase sigma factor n=1 Tax=Streptomyces carpaticus TaxID=285558 RepID=A0ABV4ZJ92_9ACTN